MKAPDVLAATWRSNYRALAHVKAYDFAGGNVTAEVARLIGASVAKSGALRVTITPGSSDAEIVAGLRVMLDRSK